MNPMLACMQNLLKHLSELAWCVPDIPYFEGDFWPSIIEETIKEQNQQAKEREASEASSGVSVCVYALRRIEAYLSINVYRVVIPKDQTEVVKKRHLVMTSPARSTRS